MVDILSYFASPLGLIALASIIPFIIVYLIRPKPLDKPIPSLMFLLKDEKVSNQRSLFRTFMRNLLFLLQLLVLLGLAFAIAQPHIMLPGEAGSDRTVIVLDSSASMKAQDGTGTRFSAAKDQARATLSGKITLIVAEHAPFVLLDNGDRQQAEQILSKLTAHDTQSAIGDAMLLAGDYAQGQSKVVVYSDFAYTHGTEPIIAAQTLRARGIKVELHQVGSPQGNIGIINMVLDKETTKVFVKNYNGDKRAVKVLYFNNDKKTTEQAREILPDSLEIYSFPTTQGINKLQIEAGDSLPADNQVFTSVPDLKKVRVLLISNIDPDKQGDVKTCTQLTTRLGILKRDKKINEQYAMVRLLSALSAVGRISCDYTYPPILPEQGVLSTYDIIVLYKFNEREITPVAYRDLASALRQGTHIIITADRSIKNPELDQLLPIVPGTLVSLNTSVSYTRSTLTKNVNFDTVDVRRLLSAELKNGSDSIASAQASPLIALHHIGNGTSLYYGMMEDYGDFHTLPDYVIFWGQVITDLTSSVDLAEYNFPTGTYAVEGAQKQLLEDIGSYTVGGKPLVANLLSDTESDISTLPKVAQDTAGSGLAGTAQSHWFELEFYLIIGALIFLCLEFIYTKARGEI